MLGFDEMPRDNAELAAIEIEFHRLRKDSASSTPVPLEELLRYLADEAPGGERLRASDLHFLRTAKVADRRYWIWSFHEPDGGDPAYVTVSKGRRSGMRIGYSDNFYGLSPEQFMLGDYHQVF